MHVCAQVCTRVGLYSYNISHTQMHIYMYAKELKQVLSTIDVKNVFYVFYYFYKNAFLTFFCFWNVFYFLVEKFFILLNPLNPTKPVKFFHKTTFK